MKQYIHSFLSVIALILMVGISACGNTASTTPMPTAFTSPTSTKVSNIETGPTEEPTNDVEFALEDFESAKFDDPTNFTNKWFPLTPGAKYNFEGFTEEAGREIPHTIIFTVTDLYKEIEGVRTIVVWILDYSDEMLVEAEIAFYAQDNDGNVWFMGEYPEVYENGKMVEAPSWIPGLKGAKAGIVMKADPQVGKPSYAQGWGPAVNWTDRGRVVAKGEQTCVPLDCYEDVLITEEFSQSEPDAFQVKYYAPGVGNFKVGWRGEDASKEILDLVEIIQLSPEELTKARMAVQELEAHAYEISKEVYDQTKPIDYKSP